MQLGCGLNGEQQAGGQHRPRNSQFGFTSPTRRAGSDFRPSPYTEGGTALGKVLHSLA